mmetsp:Transcript_70116/g.186820  ORF Transcript_70116/g.186820 Transcript_70116/m.186820 type:complete len:350 (+) Transcript_70116:433-1482(+)
MGAARRARQPGGAGPAADREPGGGRVQGPRALRLRRGEGRGPPHRRHLLRPRVLLRQAARHAAAAARRAVEVRPYRARHRRSRGLPPPFLRRPRQGPLGPATRRRMGGGQRRKVRLGGEGLATRPGRWAAACACAPVVRPGRHWVDLGRRQAPPGGSGVPSSSRPLATSPPPSRGRRIARRLHLMVGGATVGHFRRALVSRTPDLARGARRPEGLRRGRGRVRIPSLCEGSSDPLPRSVSHGLVGSLLAQRTMRSPVSSETPRVRAPLLALPAPNIPLACLQVPSTEFDGFHLFSTLRLRRLRRPRLGTLCVESCPAEACRMHFARGGRMKSSSFMNGRHARRARAGLK